MFVVNFDRKQVVHYYEAIRRHMMYMQCRPPYDLRIEDRSYGEFSNADDYSLHVENRIAPDKRPDLSLFWIAFRELGEEAAGFVKRQ